MKELVPYEIGDIVEHSLYPGALFEISIIYLPIFANVQFYDLCFYGKTEMPPQTDRALCEQLAKHRGVIATEKKRLRRPQNEMEVLAIAWAKAPE